MAWNSHKAFKWLKSASTTPLKHSKAVPRSHAEPCRCKLNGFFPTWVRTVEVDNTELINLECYRELAKKVSGHQIPPHLERKRKVKNIVYLHHQLDTVALNENTEDSLLRTLKEEEKIDDQRRFRSLGFNCHVVGPMVMASSVGTRGSKNLINHEQLDATTRTSGVHKDQWVSTGLDQRKLNQHTGIAEEIGVCLSIRRLLIQLRRVEGGCPRAHTSRHSCRVFPLNQLQVHLHMRGTTGEEVGDGVDRVSHRPDKAGVYGRQELRGSIRIELRGSSEPRSSREPPEIPGLRGSALFLVSSPTCSLLSSTLVATATAAAAVFASELHCKTFYGHL
ncbi:hypothetical protein B0H14DRAFT_2607745 [Mycena olivaceomarginata]|nr:hypothetical protein B0H14DRAFT_2607745 [Mycena olivaceomarginata]